MFEDSLVESQNRLSSPNQRWTTAVSLTIQCSLVAAVIALPLLDPEALPFHVATPKILLPTKPVPPLVPRVATMSRAVSTAAATSAAQPYTRPAYLPRFGEAAGDAPPATASGSIGMADPDGISRALTGPASGSGARVSVASPKAAQSGPLHVSTGVSAGLLLAPIVPVYPRIAVATRTEGVVVVEAIISKAGRIESARVVSGPEMLRQAALDAIRNARYTPYRLSGSPTEVETTITVNFKLSS